jgi:hypothetical protein
MALIMICNEEYLRQRNYTVYIYIYIYIYIQTLAKSLVSVFNLEYAAFNYR